MKKYYYEEITAPKILHNRKICYEPHFHSEVEIIIMYKGNATVFLNEKQYNFSTGEALIVFPNVIHSYKTYENVDVGKFIFSLNKDGELNKITNTKMPSSPIISKEDVDFSGIIPFSQEIIKNYSSSTSVLKEAYLSLLTAKIIEKLNLINRKNHPEKQFGFNSIKLL